MKSNFRARIFARDGGYCIWCGKTATDLMHLKHYGMGRSRSSGFEDRSENACAGCHECHMKHHAGQSPTRLELQAKLSELYGYAYEGE